MGIATTALASGLFMANESRKAYKKKYKNQKDILQKTVDDNKLKRRSLLDSDLVGDDVFAQNKINTFLDS